MAASTEILKFLDDYLDARSIDDYCPNGLQVEGRKKIRRIVTGVTACQRLIDRAAELGADAVLVHHGLFWKGDDMRLVSMKRKRVGALISSDMNLFAYHLPLDMHPETGNNACLARALGMVPDDGAELHGRIIAPVGNLREPCSADELAARIYDVLGYKPRLERGGCDTITRVGLCSGAGQEFLTAAAQKGAEAFITVEVSEQTVHEARELGLNFFAAGHHATETLGVKALGELLSREFSVQAININIDNWA